MILTKKFNKIYVFYKKKYFFSFFLILLLVITNSFNIFSQEISIDFGKKEIALNQAFSISIVIENGRIESYDRFPDIKGFKKRGQSNATTEIFRNGQRISSQSITQNYVASKEGLFQLEAFSMIINDKRISVPGTIIRVGPPDESIQNPLAYEDFFDETEFVEVKEDAFLGISTDKEEVFVGEGFNLILAFYVASTNQAHLEFYELGGQLTEILKQLKPANCWEEDFDIRELQREEVVINGKKYFQYKIFQANYYPLNNEPIQFSEVGLKMIKYKVAKGQSDEINIAPDKIPDFKTFYTQPKQITVKELPKHPLSEKVAVGEFYQKESITQLQITTGSSYNYQFIIAGEGNFSALKEPEIVENPYFDFYPVDVKEQINRGDGKVSGTKTFNYKIVPKEPGKFPMRDYIKWVYFDVNNVEYDTLYSDFILEVSGESVKNLEISGSLSPFYQKMDRESNSLKSLLFGRILYFLANISILLMLLIVTLIMFRK